MTRRERNALRYARWKKQPCTYLCYGEDGNVIYVGKTGNLKYRIGVHEHLSTWWKDVVAVRYRNRKTFADAFVLEALWIRKYQPVNNTDGVTR
jgi:excinuclease UvrABC nuclease subunit